MLIHPTKAAWETFVIKRMSGMPEQRSYLFQARGGPVFLAWGIRPGEVGGDVDGFMLQPGESHTLTISEQLVNLHCRRPEGHKSVLWFGVLPG